MLHARFQYGRKPAGLDYNIGRMFGYATVVQYIVIELFSPCSILCFVF